MATPRIRILCVDDHRILGNYLCELEAENGDIIGAEAWPGSVKLSVSGAIEYNDKYHEDKSYGRHGEVRCIAG
jgi:hypothetical protein